jgi:hypothetical protein
MAKPNLALIPATIGDKVYSILPSDGVGDFDFTRGTVATRINAQGLIEEVASGENRLNYSLLDGEVVGCPHLLLEPQRTNLIQYSEDFSQSYWIKTASTITSNATISPDGSLNADKLVENTENVAHITFASPTITLGNNTFSVFAKAAERRVLGIEFPSNGILVSFDLIDGVFVNQQANPDNFSITPFSNGWYRIDITENLTSNSVVSLSLRDENGNRVYQGDGTSGVYIWGAQLEEGSYSTSYIKSNSGNVTTRAAETCNGSGNAATFNDSEGVLMAEISALVNDNNFKSISVSESNADNRITLSLYQGSLFAYIADGGVGQFNVSQSVGSVLEFHKTAIKYKANDCAFWIDGFEVAINTSPTTMPSGLKELAFDQGNGGDKFYGKTKQIQYFDSILDSEQLEQLTSWDSFRAMAEGQLYTIE